MYDVSPQDRCASVVSYIHAQLQPTRSPALTKISVMKLLFRSVKGPLIISSCLRIIIAIGDFINPLLLSVLIGYFASEDPYKWKGYFLAGVMFGWNVVHQTVMVSVNNLCRRMRMRVRTAIVCAVYRKCLRLSNDARRKNTVGELINMVTVDVVKLEDMAMDIDELWAAPFMIIFSMVFFWKLFGVSSLSVWVIVAIYGPINAFWLVPGMERCQEKQMEQKDERMKVISEILNGIKVLKMYAWETSFMKKIAEIRDKELSFARKGCLLEILGLLTWHSTPYIMCVILFATYVLSSSAHVLTAQKAFVALNLINQFTSNTSFLPIVLSVAAQAYISVKRISDLLNDEEIDMDKIKTDPTTGNAIEIEEGEFLWDATLDKSTLKSIDLEIGRGELVAIVGQVGAGKSSLLAAVMGELQKLTGSVTVNGSMAYVPQQAWILNSTLRENILFGKDMDNKQYRQVVKSCALRPDLEMLTAGDISEIGEKGINLSGGQKQRVSLARAVYQDEDIYIMDDPLSAVDAHVGKQLFDEVIGPKGLLQEKTRVLVTHGLTYLPYVDKIIVMKSGEIVESGCYDDLIAQDGSLADLIKNHHTEASNGPSEEDIKRPALRRDVSVLSDNVERTNSVLGGKLIEDEYAEIGSLRLNVLTSYGRDCGLGFMTSVGVLFTVFLLCEVGTGLWLRYWSDHASQRQQLAFWLSGYTAISAVKVCALGGLNASMFLGGLRASRKIHAKLLNAVMRAPMSFFDTTPSGRMLNRFSDDMGEVDDGIAIFSCWAMMDGICVLAAFIVISYTTPVFLAFTVPVLIFYYTLQRVYLRSRRQGKRLESIRKSPVYVHLEESLHGATSIRAFRQQDRFINTNGRLIDNFLRMRFTNITLNTWLSWVFDISGSVVQLLTTVLIVLYKDSMTPGLAGLSVTYALTITWQLDYLMKNLSELETRFVAVERIKEYSEIDSEANWEIEDCVSSDWPSKGELNFQHFGICYRQGLEPALSDITLKIASGERVGIVGRTGAGKSSLTLGLFRLLEAAEGAIYIDNIDISQVGLHDLRRNLSIIPQDPVLFSGTLRFNLDPFSKYGDDEIWDCLDHAHLRNFVSSLPDQLDHQCGEGGANLSVGQRQLVCLGRCLLKPCSILVLDEATAAVDVETDSLIQNTLRTQFKHCTLLTIAHRVNTILDYDRILVLDKGRVCEFDTPANLLTNQESLFSSFVKDAGLIGLC